MRERAWGGRPEPWDRLPLIASHSGCWPRGRVAVARAAAALLFAIMPHPGHSQAIDTKLWVVNEGGVNDIVRVGNTIYVAGSFGEVGPCVGPGVPVSAATGAPASSYPVVRGGEWPCREVDAVVADGHGGWFIAGCFLSVGGVSRPFLAHVLADGSLAVWDPEPNSQVSTLCLSRDTLYVGGRFTACGGVTRRHGAAFDVKTGRLTAWDPDADAAIHAIATDGTVVFIGGSFSALDTVPRANLAAVDRVNGAATSWNPGADSVVRVLAVSGDEVYAGGYFHHVDGQARTLIAAIDRSSGVVLPWSWTVVRDPGCGQCDPGPFVHAMATDSARLYFGGSFTHVDGAARSGAAAISLTSHELTAWDPQLSGVAPLPYCYSLVVSGGVIFIGGRFDGFRGLGQRYACAVDTSGVPTEWDPRPDGSVLCLAVDGGAAYIGGEFTSTWSWQPRRFLAALDATTGEVTPWNPGANNVTGPIAISGSTVYVAGAFDTIGGQPRACLAAIDAASGEVTPWNPGVEAGIYPPIRGIVVSHGVIYVCGLFSGLGGQPRYCIGAVDSATGRAMPWYPQVDDMVETMAIRGSTLYLGGWFSSVAGEPRSYLAAVDTSGALLDWDPGPDNIVQAMTVAEDRIYIGGGFSSVAGVPRRVLAAVDCSSGAVVDWVADANPQVRCLAVAKHVLYAGGWFTQVGGMPRNGLAAIDTQTGSVLSWYPDPNSVTSALDVYDDVIYVGGAFDYLGLELRPGLAAVSLARSPYPGPTPRPGHLLAIAQNAPNPVRTSTIIRFGLSAPARVTLAIFDVAGRCMARPIENAVQDAGGHQIELSAGRWPAGIYYYRLASSGESVTGKMVVVK